jgi:catechol 2,3-dioxygenase-like lactoylglutathione lyase family enzyme
MITGIDFVALPTTDMARSQRFYQDTLGLSLSSNWEGKWVEYDVGGTIVAVYLPEAFGHTFKPSGSGSLALRVDDVEATIAALEAKGVTMDAPMTDTGVCRMAFLRDPDGNSLTLHHRYAD